MGLAAGWQHRVAEWGPEKQQADQTFANRCQPAINASRISVLVKTMPNKPPNIQIIRVKGFEPHFWWTFLRKAGEKI